MEIFSVHITFRGQRELKKVIPYVRCLEVLLSWLFKVLPQKIAVIQIW